MSLKKKLLIAAIAMAGLAPLAGCYSYPRYGYYDSYGYYHPSRYGYDRYYDRYGYRDYRNTGRDTRTYEGVRPGDPYYDNYTPRY